MYSKPETLRLRPHLQKPQPLFPKLLRTLDLALTSGEAELRAVRQKRDTLAGNAKQGERNAKRSCLRQAGLGGRSCQETADLPVDEEKVTIRESIAKRHRAPLHWTDTSTRKTALARATAEPLGRGTQARPLQWPHPGQTLIIIE